jgi:membrane associated rhomboid family serine protease
MILPLAHENLRGRRWPWVTIGIIALNTVIFLFTNGPMEQQLARTGRIELHILLLSGLYPDTPMTPEASEIVQAYKLDHPEIYAQIEAANRTQFVDDWDAQIHSSDYSAADASTEMSQLCAELTDAQSNSIAWNYAFHSVHPFARTYITATFLHGGWLHLIFNMWFLWLAGTILEDLWGRVIYPIFYLAAGALAWAVQGAVFPHSLVPALGASGAIAGLMGAFLFRFPKTRIRLGWLLWIKMIKFYVPAYIILPIWLFLQILPGLFARAFGLEAGVAYWAHIGGFAFGALGAFLLQTTGVEHTADKAVEAKVTWTADPLIVHATDSLAVNMVDDAVFALRKLLAQDPDSLDGWDLMLKAQTRKQDVEGEKEALSALCRLHVMHGDLETAATEYQSLKNFGGAELPRGVRLELCKYFESLERWETAVEEYEKLAQAYPTHRAGVSALVSAGRICLGHLYAHDRAEKFFKTAQASPAPHADLDSEIQDGLGKCAVSVVQPGQYGR